MRTLSNTTAVVPLSHSGGGNVESSVLKPSLLALLSAAANNPLPVTAALVVHCCLLTETISTSPTWELGTKPGALLPWDAFGGWLRGLLKVRLQEADLFRCSNAKRL